MTNQTKVRRISVHQLTGLLTSLLVTLLITALCAQPAAAQSEGVALSPEAQAILDGINQARQENGLPPLSVNPLLNQAAQNHVDDVIAHGNWGHYGSDGSTVQLRVARAGYPSGWVSENWVAASSPEQAMNWWLNDWVHRVNILTPYWDEVGVGVNGAGGGFYIFVTDFGNVDGSTPPALVPIAVEDSSPAAYAEDIEVETLPAEGLDYAIRPGDTLLGIGVRFGLDWQDIALANNLSENDILQIGQNLRLPGRGGVGGPVTEEPVLVAAGKQTHQVRPGETLWTIAARYSVTWETIAAVNGLSEADLLQIGQEIRLPASLDEPEPAAPPTSVSAAEEDETRDGTDAVAAPAPVEANKQTRDPKDGEGDSAADGASVASTGYTQATAKREIYTVRSGDTLLGIALQHNLAWETLAEANNLSDDAFLQIGQELELPALAGAVDAVVDPADVITPPSTKQALTISRVHTVREGDTVFGIAVQYAVDWGELLRVNGLTEEDYLQPGQKIKVP